MSMALDRLPEFSAPAQVVGHASDHPGHYVIVRVDPETKVWQVYCLGDDDEGIICDWGTVPTPRTAEAS